MSLQEDARRYLSAAEAAEYLELLTAGFDGVEREYPPGWTKPARSKPQHVRAVALLRRIYAAQDAEAARGLEEAFKEAISELSTEMVSGPPSIREKPGTKPVEFERVVQEMGAENPETLRGKKLKALTAQFKTSKSMASRARKAVLKTVSS